MQDSEPSAGQDPKTNWEDARFGNALQELRALHSQLHYAADYCETAFLNSKQKKKVVENTKEYICNAMVTVVDHMGRVSANVDCLLITSAAQPSQAELRINTLQQRLLSCQEYSHELDLANVRCIAKFPRYHPHYTSSKSIPPLCRSDAHILRDAVDLVPSGPSQKVDTRESAPLATHKESSCQPKNVTAHSTAGFEFSKALPVLGGPSIRSKPRIPSFRSQTKDSKKLESHEQSKKEVQNVNFLQFLRRTKRGA